MASGYELYYDRQPAAVKVIAVAGLAVLGYSLYRSWKKKQDETKANAAAQQAQKELQQLAQQGVKPTMALSQFENLSQAIVEAINGCGTDETAIFNVFNHMRNEADIRQLVTTFGIRHLRPCAATDPISYSIYLVNDAAFGGPLATWLYYDLDSSDIAKINGILNSHGITYRF